MYSHVRAVLQSFLSAGWSQQLSCVWAQVMLSQYSALSHLNTSKPSLAWLLHSASSQVFAVACVCLHTHSYLLIPPPYCSWIFLSTSLLPSWISPPYLLHHTVPPLAQSLSLSLSQATYFLLVFSPLFSLTPHLSRILQSLSNVGVLYCMLITPSSSLCPSSSSSIAFFNTMSTLTCLLYI